MAETGDLIDAWLRPGNVHTADGALEFIPQLLDRVERDLCQVAAVRIDAGFPEEKLLSMLEQRQTPYVARVKNNPVLDKMALPFLNRPVGRPPNEPRTWLYEMNYQAKDWSHARRVVLVVLEREEELFLHHFWLITNWLPSQMTGAALLEMYRQRGTAEGHMGELMSVLQPALSSSPRPKSHYRGEEPETRFPSGDSFEQNEVLLLLNVLAYQVVHAARVMLETATGDGWSMKRFRERVLRVAARVLVHERHAILVIAKSSARLWEMLWRKLRLLRVAEVT
ncbi:MAG: transposase [Myxococcales bacterium]|nr:transposase [Myxococcales bacterium]